MIFLMLGDNTPTCSSKFGDYLDSWGSATRKFSSLFHDKSHAKKISMPKKKKKKKKINAPPKISPQSKIFTCPYITTKFFFFNQNSYMTKIANKKFPTCPCTTSKFSHVQNHSHKNIFHDQTSHTQQNFSIAKICPLKLIHIHKICLYPQVYPYSYPQNNFAMFMK